MILILGATGMLGSMVDLYFRKKTSYPIFSTHRGPDNEKQNLYYFDVEKDISALEEIIKKQKDIKYIINCIGIIKPYCKDDDEQGKLRAIKINALFPHLLGKIGRKYNIKIIQIATDCVYSGKQGEYAESAHHDPVDVYGKTKSLGEVYDGAFLNLRCSIIGPERKGKLSLLEWILNQPDSSEINGFTHHDWNGVTTLQFAQICNEIIANNEFDALVARSNIWHCILNNRVNKFQLLKILSDKFNKNLNIKAVNNIGEPIDRTLISERSNWKYSKSSVLMEKAVEELKNFIVKENYYNA